MKLSKITLPDGVDSNEAKYYISDMAKQYGFDWDGMLWRYGSSMGNFWHISREAVEYYAHEVKLRKQPFPDNLKNVLLLNIDKNVKLLENIIYLALGIEPADLRRTGDWTYRLVQSLPFLRQNGYDGVVIVGASGSETPPPQIEVVLY